MTIENEREALAKVWDEGFEAGTAYQPDNPYREGRAPIEDAEPYGWVDSEGELWTQERLDYRGYTLESMEHGDTGPMIPLYRVPQPAKPIEVTDEMVDAAARVIHEKYSTRVAEWDELHPVSRSEWERAARAAIEAALKEMNRNG